jgi:DNA polymerase-4
VEVLKNSKLVGKPVIIGGTSDRGVVASCSYEARKYGVHSAMPSEMAKQLCPQAIFIRGNMEEYSKYSHMVTEILREKAPVLEKASIDEHYIDMTGKRPLPIIQLGFTPQKICPQYNGICMKQRP